MERDTVLLSCEKAMTVAARRSSCHMIKRRARHYDRRPGALETLHPGLSMAAPDTLTAVAEYLVERETRSPRPWFGFGGEVGLINAKAALLLGRARRLGQPRPDGVDLTQQPAREP